jgi:hypothetical protein
MSRRGSLVRCGLLLEHGLPLGHLRPLDGAGRFELGHVGVALGVDRIDLRSMLGLKFHQKKVKSDFSNVSEDETLGCAQS